MAEEEDDFLRGPNDDAYEEEQVRTGPPLQYVAERTGRVYFCACKHSAKAPLCDGTHKTLA